MVVLLAVGEDRPPARHVRVAYELATTFGDNLVALHVIPEENADEHRRSIQSLPDFEEFSFRQEQNTGARFARRVLEKELGEYDVDIVETRGRVGDPADVILAEADELSPRFLVMGGRQRSPVGKVIFGSVTQQVLLNSECPVVTAFSG